MSARYGAALALALLPPVGAALAQTGPLASKSPTTAETAWHRCAVLHDDRARLACFDRWASQQALQAPATPDQPGVDSAAHQDDRGLVAAQSADTLPQVTRATDVARPGGCRDTRYSDMSRFWELEPGSDCGTFGIRGYRPLSVSVVNGSKVNRQPSSDAAGHTALESTPYRHTETRIQLSMRTKLAQGLLTHDNPTRKDSLWFGYTQQSYWQVFSPDISRPFRATDHEPEVMYVYPSDAQLPGGWRWRYSGVGVVHQSNGQSDPLSRSWNRIYLMAGMEQENRWRAQAKIWRRLPESAANDDNPGISNYIGRGEMQVFWNVDKNNTLGTTVRLSLGHISRGSARLEWLKTVGGDGSKLRLHTQLFSGYGDSMIDFNHRRTVFGVGLSLVDF